MASTAHLTALAFGPLPRQSLGGGGVRGGSWEAEEQPGYAALHLVVVRHGGAWVVSSFLQQAQALDPGDLAQEPSKTQDPWGKA